MSTLTKVMVVLNAVVAIALSSLVIASAARWTNTQQTIEHYQTLYAAEMADKLALQGSMAALLAIQNDDNRVLRNQLSQHETAANANAEQTAALRIELSRAVIKAEAAEAGRKKLEEILGVQSVELSNLQSQNRTLLEQNIDLQTRNQRLSGRNLELAGQLTVAVDENRNLQEKNFALSRALQEAQDQLASGRRPTRADETPVGVVAASPLVAGPIRGEIIKIDGRLVSINIGESSGVVSGMEFLVYRGQTYIGDIRIDTVWPKQAGAQVTLENTGEQIRPGDTVVFGWDRG
ncbi:MAG: hypothetical protein IPM18_08835 [Phycisphaerales bacterium]|nr:hypothetical protein [Phycisphaerales bacterium]